MLGVPNEYIYIVLAFVVIIYVFRKFRNRVPFSIMRKVKVVYLRPSSLDVWDAKDLESSVTTKGNDLKWVKPKEVFGFPDKKGVLYYFAFEGIPQIINPLRLKDYFNIESIKTSGLLVKGENGEIKFKDKEGAEKIQFDSNTLALASNESVLSALMKAFMIPLMTKLMYMATGVCLIYLVKMVIYLLSKGEMTLPL